MNAQEFRRLALELPEASEGSHMGHPDFRVGGKIFATLGYPALGWGMVKLPPDQQDLLVQVRPGAFAPVKGAWGRGGATQVNLKLVPQGLVRWALLAAWRGTAPKALVRQLEEASREGPPPGTSNAGKRRGRALRPKPEPRQAGQPARRSRRTRTTD